MNQAQIWSIARLGQLLYSRDRLDEARRVFEGITAISPEHVYSWFALGMISRKRGDMKLAGDYLKHVLNLDSDFTEARVALAEVQITQGDRNGAYETLSGLNQMADSDAARRGRTLLKRWFPNG